jgi:hypothetical protein
LREGDVLTVEVRDGSVILTPAVLSEVELYTDERLREFEEGSRMSAGELTEARRAWGLPASG